MSWYTCSDCDYMDLKDTNCYNDCYCSKRHHYYSKSDTICNLALIRGRDVGGSSNCYLTTAMCDILGYEDHCCYLDTLRNIRDNYMALSVDCYDLLLEYEEVGPKICEKLYNDKDKKQIAWIMLNHYIKPAIESYEKNPELSVDIYIEMTNNLIEKYGITYESPKYERIIKKDE